MSKVTKSVLKVINSFQNSELERLLETIEDNLLYVNALHSINGGYSSAEAYDIDEDEILIEAEYGEQNMGDGCSYSNTRACSISLKVLSDKNLSLKEKLSNVVWE